MSGTIAVMGCEGIFGQKLRSVLSAQGRVVQPVTFGRPRQAKLPGKSDSLVIDPSKLSEMVEIFRGSSLVIGEYDPNSSLPSTVRSEAITNMVLAAIETSSNLLLVSHLLNSESDNARIEREVLQAQDSGLTNTLVARFPQLFGEGVVNPLWRLVYESVIAGKRAHWIGDPKVARSLLDVEDAARAVLTLAGTHESFGQDWNIASSSPLTGTSFMELAFRALGHEPNTGKWGRGIVLTGRLLAPNTAEVLEMPYDYYEPFRLDGSRFSTTFPNFRFTDPENTLSKGIKWYLQMSGRIQPN